MSSKYANTYIPLFDLADRFCYFLDLNNPKQDQAPEIVAAKQELFQEAKNNIANQLTGLAIGQKPENYSTEIEGAIEFLKIAAINERNKEIRIIKKYYQEIKDDPLTQAWLANNGRLNTLLTDLQDFSNNPSNPHMDLKEFYSTMIMLLTSIRSNSERFKQRLEVLSKTDRDTWSKIAEDDILFRQATDVDTILRSSIGIQQRERQSSLNKFITDNIIKFIENKLQDNKVFKDHPQAALVAIMLDFENFIQLNYEKIMKYETTEEREKAIDESWEQYQDEYDTFIKELQSQTQYAIDTLVTIEKMMGFRELKAAEEAYKTRSQVLDKMAKSKSKDRRNLMKKTLDKMGIDVNQETFSWKVSTGKNGQHGIVYEIAKMIADRGDKIMSSAGVDELVLDIAKIKIRTARQRSNIKKALTDSGNVALRRRNRKQDLGPAYAKSSDAIAAATEKLNEMMARNKIRDDMFIYHESLKLYVTVEEQKSSEFGGRELSILNALDNLFTINGLANTIDKNVLYAAVLNLSKYSVASNLHDPVENYLSIFAGLLMFDDIKNIAQEAARQTASQVSDTGQAFNIHLYLLNDFYIPGSLLLTTMAEALTAGYQRIEKNSGHGARVTINTNPADDIISSYLQDRENGLDYKMAHWRKIGNKIASETKIKIHFLASFFDFINYLQTYTELKNGKF